MRTLPLVLLSLWACQPTPDDTDKSDDTGPGEVADDNDCGDDDPSTYVGALELCDGIDNDCDGEVDEGAMSTFYADIDGDGFGDPDSAREACEPPADYVNDDSDCNDLDPDSYPGATEVCDGADNDCDGAIDNGLGEIWYADADNDGFGDAATAYESCDPATGAVQNADDCDDTNAGAYPGATEVCDTVDNDCDGLVDEGVESTFWIDLDGDGWGDPDYTDTACVQPTGYASNDQDCDDSNPDVSPDAAELCNGIDDDCDSEIDEDDALDADTWYADADGDSYGDPDNTALSCVTPIGYVSNDEDCDDTDASINPDTVWYYDYDYDGYGDATHTLTTCEPPAGWVSDTTDCDDSTAAAHPGATEICDGIDNDCDGDTDEAGAGGESTWYADSDGDGYGDATVTATACDAPAGYVGNDDDCDDGNAGVNPAGSEVCNGIDDDCDGLVDDDDPSVSGGSAWYFDGDGDGYGDAGDVETACDAPSHYVSDSTDCDDSDDDVNPGADEVCNGEDDDCDGTIDEADATDAGTWYADADGDGWGDPAVSSPACDTPSGYVANSDDCDDTDGTISPSELEVCDGADNDCDGLVDDDDSRVYGTSTWYFDGDGDGYGDASTTEVSCDMPADHVANDDDCDDGDDTISPAATEVCDGVDNDCDGLVDDDDSPVSGTSTWYEDADGDGYGDASSSVTACDAPAGYVSNDDDCDDTDASVYSASTEVYDGIDNDCDGTVDEGVYGEDCADILAVYPSSGNGTYTIDPDGSGGTSPFSVECEMTIDGGGWTQSIQGYLDHLSTSYTRRYLYSEGGAWYMSPVTAYVWSWSSYQYLNGTYSYATSGTSVMGTFSCTHGESGDWGVGCSNGGGNQYKVLPIYYSTPSSAYSMICQDKPDAFSAGACQANASIWSREE